MLLNFNKINIFDEEYEKKTQIYVANIKNGYIIKVGWRDNICCVNLQLRITKV